MLCCLRTQIILFLLFRLKKDPSPLFTVIKIPPHYWVGPFFRLPLLGTEQEKWGLSARTKTLLEKLRISEDNKFAGRRSHIFENAKANISSSSSFFFFLF